MVTVSLVLDVIRDNKVLFLIEVKSSVIPLRDVKGTVVVDTIVC